MSHHGELLAQAWHLLNREPKHPKQASLRRAISSAYYAVFHLLLDEATRLMIPNNQLRPLARRAFDHGEMRRAADLFKQGTLPANLKNALGSTAIVPADLQTVARSFSRLQAERQTADYDLSVSFTRLATHGLVQEADNTFVAWNRVRKDPVAESFLIALLLVRRWDR